METQYVIEYKTVFGGRRGTTGADDEVEVGSEFGLAGVKVVVTACRRVNVKATRVFLQGGNYKIPEVAS